MANLDHIVENRILRNIVEETALHRTATVKRRKILVSIAFPFLIVLLFLNLSLFLTGVILAAIAYFAISQHFVDPVKVSGVEGEYRVFNLLRQLPDTYTVFNQILVPDRNSSTGVREIDYLVCGPNGIFAIEVKNNNGTITGNETDLQWIVVKIGRGGSEYNTALRNPVRQLKAQIHSLREYFDSRGVNTWVNGIVVFANTDCRLQTSESKIPIIYASNLVQFITGFVPARPIRNVVQATGAISGLVYSYSRQQVVSIECM